MRRVTLTLSPEERFPVPYSDGYSVYAALLNVLDDVDETVSERVHDSEFGSVHVSGLLGRFGDSDRDHHKLLLPTETYTLSLGVVDPADEAIFETLVQALVFDGDRLELTDGTLFVETFESENVERGELLSRASGYDDPTVEMQFRTPTCIQERGEVTTMFPTRASVFTSLAGKWGVTLPEADDHLALDLSREAIERSVIEKPDPRSYDTHSVLVNRVRDDGEAQPIFRQGFTGTCAYDFKKASESVVNAVTALGLFAEFSGVGSAVARGCGHVSVEVSE
jgi:hypothetical protein